MEPNGQPIEEPKGSGSRPNSISPSQLDEKHTTKSAEILDACTSLDLARLRELATSDGGLVSDDIRRRACSYYS